LKFRVDTRRKERRRIALSYDKKDESSTFLRAANSGKGEIDVFVPHIEE